MNTTRRNRNKNKNTTLEIVVARFNEDLSWLRDIPSTLYTKITIYNKNEQPLECPVANCTVVQLPNLGRESHSYFTHVITNYDKLADMTLFLPASVMKKDFKKRQYDRIMEFLTTRRESVIVGAKKARTNINAEKGFTINSHVLSNTNNRAKNPNSRLNKSSLRPLGKWFEHFFPGEEMRCITHNGIVAATRDDIRKRGKEKYQALLENHSTKNPETVHYSERTWATIFSVPHCI
jgi:hypothetical protein